MTIPASTLEHLRLAVDMMLSGTGARCTHARQRAADNRTPAQLHVFRNLVMRRAGANAEAAEIVVEGWGAALQARRNTIPTAVDPTLEPDDAIALTLGILGPRIKEQHRLAAEARGAGVDGPLDGADALASTRHLSCDVDALQTLARHTGSERLARDWLDHQMALHAADGMATRDDAGTPIVRVVGARLHIPFALSPLRPARGNGEGAVWEDDTVYLNGSLPETAALAAEGRPLGDILAGTPIDDRRVRSVVDASGGDATSLAILVEARRGRVDDLLPA